LLIYSLDKAFTENKKWTKRRKFGVAQFSYLYCAILKPFYRGFEEAGQSFDGLDLEKIYLSVYR